LANSAGWSRIGPTSKLSRAPLDTVPAITTSTRNMIVTP
jgi:hypothetical protein